MHRKDLNERSPLRVLEKSIHGGLGRANLGVVVARHGVGKTAFLVGIALDDLMRGRKVLHVSLEHDVERVTAYYDEIFQELIQSQELEDVWKVRLDVERSRHIHAYVGQQFSVEKLQSALGFLKEHADFVPSTIVLDGLDFDRLEEGDLAAIRGLAREVDAEIWMSAVTTRSHGRDDKGIPEPVAKLEASLDVILTMAHDGSSVHVELLKDHDNADVSELKLALDPTTMLLVREG